MLQGSPLDRAVSARCHRAPAHCRHRVVDQTILEHRAAEGPADERCEKPGQGLGCRAIRAGQGSATFRVAELAYARREQIKHEKFPPSIYSDDGRYQKSRAADEQAREELGEIYQLIDVGTAATIVGLMKELDVKERLDGMINRCLKQLLTVRGVKSLSSAGISRGRLRQTQSEQGPSRRSPAPEPARLRGPTAQVDREQQRRARGRSPARRASPHSALLRVSVRFRQHRICRRMRPWRLCAMSRHMSATNLHRRRRQALVSCRHCWAAAR